MQKLKVYHGTNGRFSQFEQSKARIENDFYGGGVAYFTDTVSVAKTYATGMARRNGGDKIIYECSLSLNKMFDVDAEYTGDVLLKMIGKDFDQFARAAKLLTLGMDKAMVLAKLRSGSMKLKGDVVFRGMSNGMVSTKKAREKLMALGFDGLRYNGGINMAAERHSVYLAYKANQIKIDKRYIVSPKPVSSTEAAEVYTFI